MKVIEFLNKYGIERLVEEYGIKVSINDDYSDLMVLNYDQLKSPKTHEIIKECRSLVIYEFNGEYGIVSRSFDRFFNQNECDRSYDLSSLELHEKVDGSIVSVFYDRDHGWLYRTKSMLMPTTTINGWDRTWKDLIETTLGWGDELFNNLNPSMTYMFEVVARENRVVVDYKNDAAYLLAARMNSDGFYFKEKLNLPHIKVPRRYTFKTTKECIESLKKLPNLEEGYVGYSDGVPIVKVKSPMYLAAHRLKGDGLTPKRVMEMVVIDEYEEYFSVFPEDKHRFEKYINAWEMLKIEVNDTYNKYKSIDDIKEFALSINDKFYKGVLFNTRKNNGNDPVEVLNNSKDSYKVSLLESTIKEIL